MSRFFRRSSLDEMRWGVRSGRSHLDRLEDLDRLEGLCREEGIRFLVTRVPTDRMRVVQEMEQRGYFLTDTLLWFRRNLTKGSFPKLTSPADIRVAGTEDLADVTRVARAAFSGYSGHYHADPRIRSEDADEVYSDWATRGCLGDGADCVLVARNEKEVLGFGLVELLDEEEGDGRLYGVYPGARGRGIYRDLVVAAMLWTRNQGRKWMLESTQVTNTVSQRVWCRLGFEVTGSYYTFHRWFE